MLTDLPEWGKADPGNLAVPAPAKLILKVRDEPLLTADWIEHHARIVGYGNLAVFDNGSQSTEMELVLRRFAGRVDVFRYRGFVDIIHNSAHFGTLFDLLAESSVYHAILDADERLVWLDRDTWSAGPDLVGRILTQADRQVVIGTWAQNLLGHVDKFVMGEGTYPSNRDWGKPLVPSADRPPGIILHNVQAERAGARVSALRNVFVLHLSQISPGQRITANLHKLQAFGVVPPHGQPQDVIAMPAETFLQPHQRRYHDEILKLSALPPHHREDAATNPLIVTLQPDGAIRFASDQTRRALADHLAAGTPPPPGPAQG